MHGGNAPHIVVPTVYETEEGIAMTHEVLEATIAVLTVWAASSVPVALVLARAIRARDINERRA